MMGFERMANGQSLVAEFHVLRIFSVRGLVVRGIAKDPPQVFQGPSCRFAFGETLNVLTQSLVGDNLVDNEAEWLKERKASGPFLVVHIGPSPRGEISAGFVKRTGEITLTHDCFSPQKEHLAATEAQVVAPLIASLALAFSGRRQPVELLPVAREVFGKTPAGATVIDLRFGISASAHVSAPIDDAELNERTVHAAEIRRRLRDDIGQFYYLGLIEEDSLKRFLFFFLFLERLTHSVFQRLSAASDPAAVFSIPARLSRTGVGFARDALDSARSLGARFVWCSLLVWQDVTDDDIDRFKELKRERDRLSHGERTTIDPGLANRALDLCAMLVRAEIPFVSTTAPTSTALGEITVPAP